MPQRPKILFLVHRVPYPPNRGDRIRSYHMLRFLAERTEVHLACLADEPVDADTRSQLEKLCRRVAIIDLTGKQRWLRAAGSMLRGRTATEGLFASPTLRRTVGRWAQETNFDRVVVFCSSMAPYLPTPGLAGTPAVVDLVDVDSQKWLDYAATCRGPRRWLFRTEGRRLRRLESGLREHAQAVTVVTEQEAQLYRSFAPWEHVHAVTNGVDLQYYDRMSETRECNDRCVFVGALDYRANAQSLLWFCERVWPRLVERRPEARFAIVGRRPGESVRNLARLPGVSIHADVPDVRPYVTEAAVVLAPLQVARGVQNKVLEALAMGKAVVASPQAMEGLGVEAGRHLLDADAPDEWVEAVTRLMDQREERVELGRAGREYVEQHHSWTRCLESLGELLELDKSEARNPKSETNSKYAMGSGQNVNSSSELGWGRVS